MEQNYTKEETLTKMFPYVCLYELINEYIDTAAVHKLLFFEILHLQ